MDISKTKHDMKNTRLYNIWSNMKKRCLNQNCPAYHNYGGRGISVFNEWRFFDNFMFWAQQSGYDDSLTLDREDCDGNYEPSNCRWVTMREQQNNRTNNHRIEYGGKNQTLAEWAREVGLKYDTLERRLNQRGWTIEQALGFEERSIVPNYHYVPVKCLNNGKVYKSVREASDDLNIPYKKISAVINGSQKSTRGYKFVKV